MKTSSFIVSGVPGKSAGKQDRVTRGTTVSIHVIISPYMEIHTACILHQSKSRATASETTINPGIPTDVTLPRNHTWQHYTQLTHNTLPLRIPTQNKKKQHLHALDMGA